MIYLFLLYSLPVHRRYNLCLCASLPFFSRCRQPPQRNTSTRISLSHRILRRSGSIFCTDISSCTHNHEYFDGNRHCLRYNVQCFHTLCLRHFRWAEVSRWKLFWANIAATFLSSVHYLCHGSLRPQFLSNISTYFFPFDRNLSLF